MNWNEDKSLKLSITGVKLFALGMIATMIFAPVIFKAVSLIDYLETSLKSFLIIFYLLCIPAALALGGLYKLLKNIDNGVVFEQENVSILRGLSWRCMLAGVICLASRVVYIPFAFIAACAGFAGLVLRVVKNVFAQAVEIKQDNDYTI